MLCVLGFIMPKRKEIGVPLGRNMSEGPLRTTLRKIGAEKLNPAERRRLNLLQGSGKSVYCRTPKGEIFLVRESNLPTVQKKNWAVLPSRDGKRLLNLQRNARK